MCLTNMEMYKNTEENIITISYELGFIGETFFSESTFCRPKGMDREVIEFWGH